MADSKSDIDDSKKAILEELLKEHVNLTDAQLSVIFGTDEATVTRIRTEVTRVGSDSNEPLSWDYVLAFNVGKEDVFMKPKKKEKKAHEEGGASSEYEEEWENGIPQRKYNGQIVLDIEKRLKNARLSVKKYKNRAETIIFLVVGITEKNLFGWADARDTDLLIDAEGAIKEGRERNFPLAKRTAYYEDEIKKMDDPNDKHYTIGKDNWESMYVQYNPRADLQIYKKYPRIYKEDGTPDGETIFDEKTRLRIIYEAIIADENEGGAEIKIEDYLFNKKHPLAAIFPLHDARIQDMLSTQWMNWQFRMMFTCPLELVRSYFGEPVGFYFGFLQFYLRWLVAPGILGIIFFILQLAFGQIDAPGIFLCSFFIIFWNVAFVDFWAREESRLRLRWGMTKFEQKAVARPQFRGEWGHNIVTGLWEEQFSFFKRSFRMTVIFSGVSTFLAACIVAVFAVLLLKDRDPESTLIKIGLGVANGTMIFVFDIIYKVISKYGNEWENHRTQQDYENALITKNFFFKFFNSFSSLFFIAFIRPSYNGDGYYFRFFSAVNTCSIGVTNPLTCTCDTDTFVTDAYCNSIQTYPFDETYYDDVEVKNVYANFDNYTHCYQNAAVDVMGETSAVPNSQWNACVDGYEAKYGVFGNTTRVGQDQDGVCTSAVAQVCINDTVMSDLRIQLASLFGSAIIIQNTLEVGIPYLIDWCKDRSREKKEIAEYGLVRERSEPEEQMDFGAYLNTIDDMAELMVQFGYVTLFIMALPITPLLAVLNNIFEMKVDGYNLIRQSQRPFPNGSYGLGAWNGVLSFFSIVSVGTNVALITWRTTLVTLLLENNSETGSNENKWIFFSILSIALACIVAVEKFIIPDVPIEVEAAIERQKVIENVLVLGAQIDPDGDDPPDRDDDDDDDAPAFTFDPSLEFQEVEPLPIIPAKDLHNPQSHSEDALLSSNADAGAGKDQPASYNKKSDIVLSTSNIVTEDEDSAGRAGATS